MTALRKDSQDRGLLMRQTLLVLVIEKCEEGIWRGGGRGRHRYKRGRIKEVWGELTREKYGGLCLMNERMGILQIG